MRRVGMAVALGMVVGWATACGGGTPGGGPGHVDARPRDGVLRQGDGVGFPKGDANLAPAPDGSRPMFGGPGPWPTAPLTVYGMAQGIQELPVVEAQPDEAQNLWLVTNQALYLLQPGKTTFRRYTDADGLHLALSEPPGITAVAGGATNTAYVGYEGYEDGNSLDDTPYQESLGKLDRVVLDADGTLTVTRFNVHDTDAEGYWENRSVRRFLYDHFHHPGNLYIGFNHGVDRLQGNTYSDHVHVEVCAGGPCGTAGSSLRIGEWRGLAFDAAGNTWQAGEYSAGLLGYTDNVADWIFNAKNHFIVAFGDPYPPYAPVFQPPAEGDPVNIRAVAVTPDGTAWFASGPQWSDSDPVYGLASYAKGSFTYYDPLKLGFPSKLLYDMVARPDGTLVFGLEHDGLVYWKPGTSSITTFTTTDGLPSNEIQRLYLDTMVNPPALYVATAGGLAVLR